MSTNLQAIDAFLYIDVYTDFIYYQKIIILLNQIILFSNEITTGITEMNPGLLLCVQQSQSIYWHWIVVKEITAFISGHQRSKIDS